MALALAALDGIDSNSLMGQMPDHHCICGHAEHHHLTDGDETICLNKGCSCSSYVLWEARFRDQDGNIHVVHNVSRFVHSHPELFNRIEMEDHQRPSSGKVRSVWSLAETGLGRLLQRTKESWHGWTVHAFPKKPRPASNLPSKQKV